MQECWLELQKIIPLEWLLVIYTAFPFIGKGIASITVGICKFQFPFWEVIFLCSLGTSIKAGYYFPIIYGIENYLQRSDSRPARIIRRWFYRNLEKAKKWHRIFHWILESKSLQMSRKKVIHLCEFADMLGCSFLAVVPLEILIGSYKKGFSIFQSPLFFKALLFIPAFGLLAYVYKKRNNKRIVYISLLVLPNIGLGILTGACLAYLCKVRFWRGIATVVAGSVASTILIASATIFFRTEVTIIIDWAERIIFS